MARVRVADGTQVNRAGKVYMAGEIVELPDDEAQLLLAANIVEKAESKKREAPKGRRRS